MRLGCCEGSLPYRDLLPVTAPSRASSLPHETAIKCGSELAREWLQRGLRPYSAQWQNPPRSGSQASARGC
ncbi:hypothetical protein DBR24_23315 [Pseudomonas sp. HMWF006]|nr:hypothetical protein DBR24_23315 [Pseudomonas sp. HMWF006]PTT67625.1 hypothetical protein DBR26_14825 [Pseudomonas sp. HMWF007]PTT88056.1 hypothetical protein DBR29_18720 [Pseudomonas sp. HMWF005]